MVYFIDRNLCKRSGDETSCDSWAVTNLNCPDRAEPPSLREKTQLLTPSLAHYWHPSLQALEFATSRGRRVVLRDRAELILPARLQSYSKIFTYLVYAYTRRVPCAIAKALLHSNPSEQLYSFSRSVTSRPQNFVSTQVDACPTCKSLRTLVRASPGHSLGWAHSNI